MTEPIHITWFELGNDCEILMEKIDVALKKATEEDEKNLREIKEDLVEMMLSIRDGDYGADQLECAYTHWSYVYSKYLEAIIASAKRDVAVTENVGKVDEMQEEGHCDSSSENVEVNNGIEKNVDGEKKETL